MVFIALILSRITYALPAWGGQLTRQQQERLDAFLKRVRKFGFCDENCTTAELLDKTDAGLFRLVQGPEHCLGHLLPDTINSCLMDLRHRSHSFPLPRCKYNLYKNSFFHSVCSNMCIFDSLYVI